MLRPDAEGVSWGASLAIVSAGAAALGALMTRVLAPTQTAATLMFWQTSITLIVLALANPSFTREEREPLSSVVSVVVDKSPSQNFGDRAREAHRTGRLSAQALRSAEDTAIGEVIRRQEEIGLKSITDGELRRQAWQTDFYNQIGGIVKGGEKVAVHFENDAGSTDFVVDTTRVGSKLHLDHTIFGEEVGEGAVAHSWRRRNATDQPTAVTTATTAMVTTSDWLR